MHLLVELSLESTIGGDSEVFSSCYNYQADNITCCIFLQKLVMLIEVAPHIAVWVRDKITSIELDSHHWVLSPPGSHNEGKERPRGVLVELGEAAWHEASEQRHCLVILQR